VPADHQPDLGARPGTAAAPPAWVWVGVGVAVLVGIVLRLLASSPLWLDEALSVNISRLPLDEIGGALRQDGHPPLYYWLLHVWSEVVGDSDGAVRFLSVLLGVGALPLGWALGRRIGGWQAASWTVVLLALAPYTVRYSTEARMYALVMVLVLAGAILVLDAIDDPSMLRLAGIAAVAAALLYTQYWAFYLLASLGAVLLWRWRSEPAHRGPVVRILAAMAVGGVPFLLWLPAFLDQVGHTGTPWAVPARPTQVISDVFNDLGGGGLSTFAEGLLFGILTAVLIAVAVLTTPRDASGEVRLTASGDVLSREVAAVAFGTLAIGAVVGFVGGAAFNSRYASTVVPLLIVLAAVGLSRLPRGWPAAGCALALVVLAPVASARVVRLDRTESGSIAGFIVDGARPGDAVLVCPDQLGVSLERALREAGSDIDVVSYPEIDGDPRFVRWRDYQQRNNAADPEALAAEVSGRVDGDLWLVMNIDYRTFEGDCEAISLTLAALRGSPESPREQPDERSFEHADLLRFGPAG